MAGFVFGPDGDLRGDLKAVRRFDEMEPGTGFDVEREQRTIAVEIESDGPIGGLFRSVLFAE